MPNRIICAIDFSESSKAALRWSIDMAKKQNSHLTILHAYRLIKQNNEAPQKKKIEEDAYVKLGVLESELLSGSGITYDIKIEVGFVKDRVEELLKAHTIDFLVMCRNLCLQNKETIDDIISQLQIPLVIIP